MANRHTIHAVSGPGASPTDVRRKTNAFLAARPRENKSDGSPPRGATDLNGCELFPMTGDKIILYVIYVRLITHRTFDRRVWHSRHDFISNLINIAYNHPYTISNSKINTKIIIKIRYIGTSSIKNIKK